MNDWFRKLWCKVFFDQDNQYKPRQYKPRKVDVRALVCAIEELKHDPMTKSFLVKSYNPYGNATEVFFEGVCVAKHLDYLDYCISDLTDAGKDIGDDLIKLMQAIIDKHQTMKALETAERAARARKALNEAKASLAEK